MPVSRRGFLAQSAGLFVATSGLSNATALSRNNLGVELYTVRDVIGSDPKRVLRQIHDAGYSEVEATADTLKQAWSAIEHSGLKAVSVHLNLDPTDAELADVKQKGFLYAVIPYVQEDRRGGADVMKRLGASFQKAGERAKAHGLQLCYHNHAFEFKPLGGKTGLEILLAETDPSTVQIEMDIFWVSVAGHDPVEMLGKYSGRVPLLHLKDKAKGMPASPQFNEHVPPETFKEVGNGSIDIPAVLRAADKAGVKHYFVEQDQTHDPIASLRQSFDCLKRQF